VIAELRSQLNFTDTKCYDFQNEITTLKSYVVDLKSMIQMLLNPDGVKNMKKEQQAEIALTAFDPHLDSYAQVTQTNGNPTRFFNGKVSVTKDLRATSPMQGN
jgi:hypothetical protein